MHLPTGDDGRSEATGYGLVVRHAHRPPRRAASTVFAPVNAAVEFSAASRRVSKEAHLPDRCGGLLNTMVAYS